MARYRILRYFPLIKSKHGEIASSPLANNPRTNQTVPSTGEVWRYVGDVGRSIHRIDGEVRIGRRSSRSFFAIALMFSRPKGNGGGSRILSGIDWKCIRRVMTFISDGLHEYPMPTDHGSLFESLKHHSELIHRFELSPSACTQLKSHHLQRHG